MEFFLPSSAFDMWNNDQFQSVRPGLPYAVKVLLIANVGLFLLQKFVDFSTGNSFSPLFGLSGQAVLQGQVWRLVTYMFLHGDIWHIFINMLMLVVFGREMESLLGTRSLTHLYFGCGMLAGIGWIVISGAGQEYCIGASGAVFGIMGAFAAIFPERRITLLLFFVLPVNVKARTMAIGLGIIALLSLMGDDGSIAHAAHLAGGLAGYLYGRRARRTRSSLGWRQPDCGRPSGRGFGRSTWRWPSSDEESLPTAEEIDDILEKITRRGIGSLSRSERDALERASQRGKRAG